MMNEALKKHLLACTIALQFAAGCSSTSPITPYIANLTAPDSLDQTLNDIVQAGITPGLAVTVVKDDRVVYQNAIGRPDARGSRPITPDGCFNLWSVSKVFTQLLVLDLASSGAIHLDDPACRYLAWFEDNTCSNVPLPQRTIRSLLNHTAGVPDPGFALYAP